MSNTNNEMVGPFDEKDAAEMKMGGPLLSVVIANYNYGRFLEAAIHSIVSQSVACGVELIICDAGSSDISLDVIRKYANGLPPNQSIYTWHCSDSQPMNSKVSLSTVHISWWCSEKDGGQSAALNKGFSRARGRWLTWVNADDLLMPGTLAAFSNFVLRHPDSEWVTGNMLSFDSATLNVNRVNWGPHLQPPFLRRNRSVNAVFGPTTFWKRSLYEKIGPLDEEMHYSMDTEYWARMTMAGIKQYRLNHICWGFRIHSESKTAGVQTEVIQKRREEETRYWREKTGYRVQPKITNVWYLIWVLWRFVDFSWLARAIKKRKYEGKTLDRMFPTIEFK